MTKHELKGAVERVEKYLIERPKIRQLDKEVIHGLHGGDDREADLTVSDIRTILAALPQGDELERLRDCLLGIALSDRYRRYPKQHEDGGVRGQSGLRAVRALTGQHGSYLNDEDVVRLDKEARAALSPSDQSDRTSGEER